MKACRQNCWIRRAGGHRANKALKNKACKSSSEEDEDEDEDDEESDHEEAGRDRSRSRDDDRDDAPQDAEPGDKSGSEGEQHTPKKPTKTLRRMRSKGRGERHWTTRMLFFVALSSVHLFTHVFMKELFRPNIHIYMSMYMPIRFKVFCKKRCCFCYDYCQ